MVFAENAAKLSQKMSQGLVDNAREFGFPTGGESGAQYFDTSEEKMRNIKRQLDAKNDREKLDGLKRLIAVRIHIQPKGGSVCVDVAMWM